MAHAQILERPYYLIERIYYRKLFHRKIEIVEAKRRSNDRRTYPFSIIKNVVSVDTGGTYSQPVLHKSTTEIISADLKEKLVNCLRCAGHIARSRLFCPLKIQNN